MQSTLSLLPKEKDHRVRAMGVLSAVEHIFNETAMHAKAQASNRMAKATIVSHGPRVSPHSQAKARVKKTSEIQRKIQRNQEFEPRCQRQKLRNRDMCVPLTLTWNDGWNWNGGWSFDEWNDDWSSVGWHEGWGQTYDTSASSFSLGGLDVSATSSPKRFKWVKMSLDTGAAVNTFPLNFSSEGAGDGRFYRTACGEWILIVELGYSKDTMKMD